MSITPAPTAARCGSDKLKGYVGPPLRRALVRQAKLGASCGVQVPTEQGLTNHSYRVLQLWRKHDVSRTKQLKRTQGTT